LAFRAVLAACGDLRAIVRSFPAIRRRPPVFQQPQRIFHRLWPVIHTGYGSLIIGLEGRGVHCFYSAMSTTLIEIRRAKTSDATDVAGTHDEAWRAAYQGIIPGNELDKLISRRGPDWWDSAIRKGSRITILQFGEQIAGYANYGRNRARSLFYDGEIYEIYLRPEFQGLGFGRRLFSAARKDLTQSGLKSMVVWALSDNDPAVEFYRALGGRAVARSSERFGQKTLDKVAYAWQG
jgi:ribosomal protein S18 acetylase RimI-like enzyme